jgi:hypothetical protein
LIPVDPALKMFFHIVDIRVEDDMEYKILIQENLGNGDIYMHTFPLEPATVSEAFKFRSLHYHADCVFVLEYCEN